ncbi:MAG: tetratricopeptide repeat protein, partial [Gammaproteobacteria bacterium]|nr:tetratricopeptide repeat protein [Gammaproteobacteria bacterium]
ALFEQVVATDDENAEARLELARLQMKYGDPETAKVLLEGLLFRYGPTAVTYAALAETLRRLGDEEQSQYYQALIPQYRGLSLPGSDPVLVEVQRLNLGDKHLIDGAKSMLAKGETDNGIRLLEIALKRNPNSVPAYAWLLAAHGSRGEFDLVEQYYQQALEAGPPTLNLLANLGKARARNGQFAEARVAFQQALELDPQNASMKAALGSVARREGQAAEAEHLFKEAVRLDPLHRAAHFSLGEMLVQQKRYEEAIEHLEAAVRDPDRATVAALTYLGFTTTQMGQTDAARSYLRRALLIAEEMGDPGQGQRAQRMLDAMP